MFKIRCRCGKSEKNFKFNIGPYFVNECCEIKREKSEPCECDATCCENCECNQEVDSKIEKEEEEIQESPKPEFKKSSKKKGRK